MKKTAQNDITGAWIVSKPNNEMFEQNWDKIFRPKLVEFQVNETTGEVEKVKDVTITNS